MSDYVKPLYASIIVATDNSGGIGIDGQLPWNHIPSDMKFFTSTTMNSVVLMGRKTWDSLPLKHRPLKGRLNLVLTRDITTTGDLEGATKCTTLDAAFDVCMINGYPKLYIIGGAEVYNLALKDERVKYAYMNTIPGEYNCDTFFDYATILDSWHCVDGINIGDGVISKLYVRD